MTTQIRKLIPLTLLSAALVLAQRPGGGAPRTGTPPDPARMAKRAVMNLTDALDLTDAQQTQATKIFTDSFTAAQPLQASLRTTRDSLAEAIKTNTAATTNTLNSLAAQIGTLTGQLVAIHSTAEAHLYAILTPDQQTKFADLPGGFGGFGGPGGFGFGRRGFGPPPGGGPAHAPRPRQQQQ